MTLQFVFIQYFLYEIRILRNVKLLFHISLWSLKKTVLEVKILLRQNKKIYGNNVLTLIITLDLSVVILCQMLTLPLVIV